MSADRFPKTLVLRGIAALLLLAAVLALPTADAAASPGHWLSGLFPGLSLFLLSSIRQFAAVPLAWGSACFFVLGWVDWRAGKAMLVALKGRARLAVRVICLLLAAALIYWTSGFVLLTVWPPMPFGVGLAVMNHPEILGLLWCILALLWQCVLEGSRAGRATPSQDPT